MLLGVVVGLAHCSKPAECPQTKTAPAPTAPAPFVNVVVKAPPTVAEAKAFYEKVDRDLRRLFTRRERMGFVSLTFINDDTQKLAALAEEDSMEYLNKAIQESARFDGLQLPPDLARMHHLLKLAGVAPAPSDATERGELAGILANMSATYGKGKFCSPGTGRNKGKEVCRNLGELSEVMAKSQNFDELKAVWEGWRTISPPMRKQYERFVTLSNKGSKEIGFDNVGDLWRAGYDMKPEEFSADVERLWSELKPLYDSLHCYVRSKLQAKYGKEKIAEKGLIPAHVLGNMWSQDWANIYQLVAPYPKARSLDVTAGMKRKKMKALDVVKLGEKFFVSLGMDPLPKTFWTRSMFTKPRDREVECHASAWDVGYNNDLRIKMCIKVDEEDLTVVHHELGHDYYYHYYYEKPLLFQSGANDGFHEGIGDTLALSITPSYLEKLGLIQQGKSDDRVQINELMKRALSKVAFLPFGLLIDKWRWGVFSGKIKASDYNRAWWSLREKYQGIKAPSQRGEEFFDPGAKYHVPANTPYMRYFLAAIYQFQFHRALCKAAGHTGPLASCSIYGNTAAGDRLKALLKLGASKPWPDALEAMTGERQASAKALIEYFAPLATWLKEQNKGQSCGWSEETASKNP
jgi:peptidyl-dipeptidase A